MNSPRAFWRSGCAYGAAVRTVLLPAVDWMDATGVAGENSAMGRYRHQVYALAKTPRFCVIFNLQWQVIESVKLAPVTNLARAMSAAIERQSRDGWLAENNHEFGFVFLRRDAERRLLILTERDPYDMRPQSFSPFGR
jgi:hypothetical protein